MNLQQLKEKGGFVTTEPVRKGIVWKHKDPTTGEEVEDKFDVFIKKRSFGSVERLFGEDENDRSKMAQFLASSVLLGEGDEQTAMTYHDAYQLEVGLATVLVSAVNEVNGTGKNAKK